MALSGLKKSALVSAHLKKANCQLLPPLVNIPCVLTAYGQRGASIANFLGHYVGARPPRSGPKKNPGDRGAPIVNSGENISGSYKETDLNRRYFIIGERRISSYWWASVIFLGGFGFLLTGISSYIKYNLFTSFDYVVDKIIESASFILQNSQALPSPSNHLYGEIGGEGLVFFPQGLLMCFYGSLGLLLSLYWWLLIYWNVGGGFNEFNKKEGFMRIFRWGYPGKNRRIDIVYSLKDIEAIRVELKQSQGLLSSEQTIFVRLSTPSQINLQTATKGASVEKREIPLGGIGQPLTLKEIEKQASELANYLQVTLEGL